MVARIGCIVEGHGDGPALQVIVRRIAALIDPGLLVELQPTIRRAKSYLVSPGGLEGEVGLVAREVGSRGAILILLDSDDDCPAELGPGLLRRATQQRGDIPIAVVLAKREFEGWLLASAESLRGQRGLAADLQAPADPEGIRGAKEWLSRHMPLGQPYREVLHQPALAARFDLQQARRADSFDKCYREIVRLLTLQQGDTPA